MNGNTIDPTLDTIWIVRSPEGRVIGASVRSSAAAIMDTLAHCDSTTRMHVGRLQRYVELQDAQEDRYELHGYTLTREPLPAPVAAWVTIPKTVRKAGFALSNCAFNLAQSDRLTDRERQYLDECRKAWEGAVTAADSPQTPGASE